jgi:hypothetical protein
VLLVREGKDRTMSEPIRIGDQDVEPVVVRGIPCLKSKHAAALLGLTNAGFIRKAEDVGLTKLPNPLRRREAFYPIEQLLALKQGFLPPRVEDPDEGRESNGKEARRIDPDMIDNVPCLDKEQAIYYLNMQPHTFSKWFKVKGMKTRERDGETYYALAQLIAWRRGEPIPDVEW